MRFFLSPAKITTPRLAWLILLFAALVLAPTSAVAEYRLQSGDILQVSVTGIPDFRQRCPIGAEGKITLPVVGQVKVGGLSLPDARAAVARALSNRLYRQSTNDGREVSHLIQSDEIVVAVVEYRPVYVTEGVAKPGAYPYRPGMTVRDAIALAGGYGRDMLLEGISARDQYNALLIEFVRLQIVIARLRAELAGRTEIDLKGLQTTGVTPPVLSEFVSMEAQQLKADQDDYDNQKTYLSRLIKETQDEVSALLAEQAQQQVALAQQQQDAARIQGLFKQSLVQISRLEEEQRAVAGSEMQLFEVKARTAQARRNLAEYARALQKLADQRKSQVLQRLETTTGQLAAVQIHLETANSRLRYVEAANPQGLRDDSVSRSLVIFRNEDGNHQRIAADQDTILLPGDAVEIAPSRSEPLVGLARSTGDRATVQESDLAAGVSGNGQSLDGNRSDGIARASLPPMRIAVAAKADAAFAAPSQAGTTPKPAVVTAYRIPVRVSGESAGSTVPPQPRYSASQNMVPRKPGAPMTAPPGVVPAKTAPPAVTPSTGDRSTGQRLREEGDMKILDGDLASARLFYELAAKAGDARAALDLGNSFNPGFLNRLGVFGMRGNVVVAARWYRRARSLGDPDAEKALRTLR